MTKKEFRKQYEEELLWEQQYLEEERKRMEEEHWSLNNMKNFDFRIENGVAVFTFKNN